MRGASQSIIQVASFQVANIKYKQQKLFLHIHNEKLGMIDGRLCFLLHFLHI